MTPASEDADLDYMLLCQDVTYFINLISELKQFGIDLPEAPKPSAVCLVFKDNVGAPLELANSPKLRPQTKHLAIQLHHF